MENMTSTQLAQLLYVAYYGRPADASGLAFWAEQIDAVGVEGVAADFGASAEFEARFGDLTNEELVQNLYQQLFGRDGEQAGVDYWVNLLENGTPLAQIALEIANGAQNADITAINNKVAVAQRFTEAAGDDYAGDDAANIARDFLLTVDADTDAETADVEGALDSVADLTTFTLAEAQAAEALPAKYTIEDSAANLVAAASAAAITTLANAEAIVVAGGATVEQMNALINVSEYSNIESYTLNDTVENLLAGGDIVANAASATVAGEPVLTVAQYNEIAAVATVETYTVVDTAEAILEAGADAAALANAGSVAITDEAVTLEQAVALDALDLDVAYPAVDVSLEAAAAADTLPANYALTADVFAAGEVTVEAATAAFGAVSAIVEGAANAEELAVADLFTWSIADTLENIDAADAAVIEGADAYTLTNEAGDLGELTGEQYELVLGAANADDYTYTVVPSPITGISAQGPVVEGNEIAFTVEMDYAVNVDRVISYQIEGAETGTAGAADALADLGLITGTVTIPAGETTGTITLTPLEDGTTEGREAFTVSLLNDDATEVVATSNVVVIEDNANAGQNVALTTGIDEETGGAGNDTFSALIDTDTAANSTLNALDSIDGLGGNDTLRVNVQGTNILGNTATAGTPATVAFPTADISNVENLLLRSGAEVDLDLTEVNWEGLALVNVTRADAALTLTAADTTDFNVSGARDNITLDGGQNIVVNDAEADNDITIGATTVNNGTIEVTDTAQGTGAIAIDGGTDVTVEATSDDTGTITVGQGGDEPTGTINVTQNLESDGAAAFQGGDITTTGGTTVDITVNANSVAEADDSTGTMTVGNISVTGGDSTTDVTVTQNDNSEQFTSEDEGGRTETASVKFGAMLADETLEIAGLTFTASKNLTAEEVAQAFSELTATDTQDAGGPVENGFYTGQVNGNWTSGEASGDTVVFTSTTANAAVTDLDAGNYDTSGIVDAARRPAVTTTQGQNLDNVGATSTNGVVYGQVVIADGGDASIANVTVDGFADASTVTSDALENLTLRNNNEDANLTVTTAATALNLTLDGISSSLMDGVDETVIDLDNVTAAENITDLTLTTEGDASSAALVGAAVTDLTINAGAALNLDSTSTDLGALLNATIAGDAAVNLGDISAANLDSFDASGNTGGVTATVSTTSTGDIEEFVFSQGDDVVTLANVGMDVTVDGGEGTDRVVSTAALLSGSEEVIAAGLTSFEEVEISDQVDLVSGNVEIDFGELGFDYIVTNGTTSSAGNALRLNNLTNNSTVVLAGAQAGTTAGSIEANIADAGTNGADVLNLVVETQDDAILNTVTTLDAGTLVANDVETINVDSTTADADGGDNVLTLDADSATNVTVTGAADLDLTISNAADLTLVDASTMMGDFTYIADVADVEVNGGAGADDLTAAASDVTLNGGAGNDTLTVNVGANRVELFGGEGNDRFEIAGASSSSSTYAIIRDINAGDQIEFAGATAFRQAEVTLSEGATESTQAYANEAIADLAANEMGWFQFGGNTFIVMDAGADTNSFVDAQDMIVMINGEVDLSTASFNDSGIIEIA